MEDQSNKSTENSKIRHDDVLIGTPTHFCKSYCAEKFSVALFAHANGAISFIACNSIVDVEAYYQKSGAHFIKLNLGEEFYDKEDSIHRRITHTMNLLREEFLSSGKKFFLSLEADVLLAEDTIDRLKETMHAHNADVVHANCYTGFNTSIKPSVTKRLTLGCTLIKREVLEAISFRYDPSMLNGFHDAFFAHDCADKNFLMIYDPAAKTIHLHDNANTRGWNSLSLKERIGF